jgi:predicted AAA+ superfamily ATPase
MPEAVSVFAQMENFDEVRRTQRNIIDMYSQDFSKHAPGVQVPRIRMLWNSIYRQLAKENKKFQYSQISKDARSREFENALLWILDTGIAHMVSRAVDVKHPLKAYADTKAFKLYLSDIGLLSCMSGLDKDILFDGDSLFVEFKGSLAEQYVLQELVALGVYSPLYWSRDNARAEVDFLIQAGKNIVPLEVKSGINLRAKSLQVYIEEFSPARAVRISLSDYKISPLQNGAQLIDVPLYCISMLPKILA